MERIFLATGSNLGDKAANLSAALALIEELVGSLVAVSGIYRTAAWGIEDQPEFLNQALAVDTVLNPETLLATVLDIEHKMGRERVIRWGERLIDIDVLFYGNLVYQTQRLTIPHPFIQERNFVLQPLLEIAPDFVHPVLHRTIRELADESQDPLSAILYGGSNTFG
jgi:2-amino-4-hydroxy-6-hydroxymethyldihydropteridine diphosphokinase